MPAEKSLLTKIREKELEVSVKIDDIRVEADQMIDQARKKSQAIITASGVEGKKAADEYLEKELKRVRAEADQIKDLAKDEVESIRKKGEKNVTKAVERIIAIVLEG
jgi:vacuolar-type H+-ATPase subunit H